MLQILEQVAKQLFMITLQRLTFAEKKIAGNAFAIKYWLSVPYPYKSWQSLNQVIEMRDLRHFPR